MPGRKRVPRVFDGLEPGDRVEVRCDDPHPAYGWDWRPGTVLRVARKGPGSVTVDLDEPIALGPPTNTTFSRWSTSSLRCVRRIGAVR